MNTNALIEETLKYLETDENKKPKYKFKIYRSGLSDYYNKATNGLIKLDDKWNEDATPVTVYTIGDVFDTISDISGDITKTISALPATLDNIKASLKQLGYSALDTTINTIKTAVIPIEVIQTVNDVYRIARPLVEKIVDIASIMFYYESAAKVTQDILQYLTRLAVSTAKNALDKLWRLFLNTPIFAIYEDDQTINLSGAYAAFSEAANNLIDEIAQDSSAFAEIMNYANASGLKTYEPKYSNMGINIEDTIVDVCSDMVSRKIYVASEHKIYAVNDDYTTSLIFTTNDEIGNIFCYGGEVFYIVGNSRNVVKQVITETQSQSTITVPGANFSVVFGNPIFLFNSADGKIYEPLNSSPFMSIGNVKYHTYNPDNDIIYIVILEDSKYKLLSLLKDSNGAYHKEVLSEVEHPYGISYFNGVLYVVLKDSSDKYYISKISAGLTFNRNLYSFVKKTPRDGGLIWIDDGLATDGNDIFSYNGNVVTHITPSYNSINCVTQKTYNGSNYYVCSGGIHIYLTSISQKNGVYSYNWKTKNIISGSDTTTSIPDNIAGLKWYNSDAYGQFLLANSQERIYVFGPDKISQIFDIEKAKIPEDLVYKEYDSFDSWFNKTNVDEGQTSLQYSSVESIRDNCIITSVDIIGKQIYVGLFSPKYSSGSNITKCGVYKASVGYYGGAYRISIDYDHPVIVSEDRVKIYSFAYINDCWYYSDGKKLYNSTNALETDLKLDSKEIADRALMVTKENNEIVLYTSKSRMRSVSNEQYGEITALAKYKTSTLPQIASTRNILMFSDYDYVYSMVNNGNDAINYDLFQICYKQSAFPYRLVQSTDAVFIVSMNSIKKVPFYSSITSSNYGCGYYTDTTPNKWYGAAPYYFASNILNENKNTKQKSLFVLAFKENFKVELTKLLKNIPDAFVKYSQDKLTEELRNSGITIEGDDGQIAELIIKTIAGTTANSMGMFIQQKFFEKIGDDTTYESFATQVYNMCMADSTNNMTKDFYDIFEKLYKATIDGAVMEKNIGTGGISDSLLRYYQNHKSEWASSMTDLIDVDVVKPEDYEIPLNSGQLLSKTTYKYSYPDEEYKYEYIADPSKKYSPDNIKSGYLYNGKFYEDQAHTIEIDSRTKVGDDYYDADGNIICYGDGEGNYYTYKLQDYILTSDQSIDSGKTYYTKSGNNQYIYSHTTDETEQPNKPYFVQDYMASEDITVDPNKAYFTKAGGGYDYILQTSEDEISPGILPNDSYFIKDEYAPTEDTEINDNKTYYVRGYQAASGSVVQGTQYYKQDYVPTRDTELNNNKNYYEFTDFSEFVNEVYYEYNPTSSATKYSINYVQETGSLDLTETYYTRSGNEGSYVYTMAENVNEQYGPYFKADGFVQDANGEYIEKTFNAGVTSYTLVTNPVLNNLASYYELDYVPISTPSSTAGKFIIAYTAVIDPIRDNIDSYYERTDSSYSPAEDLNYEYNSDGDIVGVKNDRNLYKVEYEDATYTAVVSPSGSPAENGYYEYNYIQIEPDSSNNPYDEGLFERVLNEVAFTAVENPDVSHISEYYEYSYSYSTLYKDNRIYIDLAAVRYSSNFDAEDNAWHNMFYTDIATAKSSVTSSDVDIAKSQAFSALSEVQYTIYPSDDWQMLITKAVSEYYIPTQGEQFRQIVLDSDMYPIMWNELPDKIDRKAFDYALTALLYAIKQRLMTNITILVDGGKVKCYSCVDATSVIKKIVDRNGLIWNNQIKMIKSRITKATSADDVRKAFDIIRTFDPTRYILERILVAQSRLYSSYIDQLIEAQIINDNDTEVMM